jgi:flagellar export protein FliJ
MQVRQCWSVLEGRAKQVVTKLQTEVIKTRTTLQTLKESQQRLATLYEEYRVQGQDFGVPSLGMQDAMNRRQFMGQLQNLQLRVTQDIGHAENALIRLTQQMARAELDRRKMQTLDELEQLAHATLLSKREQRSMDEMGVMQFNRQNAT